MQVCKDILYGITDALARRDFETYLSYVNIPYTIVTPAGTFVRSTRQEMRNGFDVWLQDHSHIEVERLNYEVLNWHVHGDDRQSCVYRLWYSELEQQPQSLGEAIIEVVRTADGWRATSITAEISGANWPMILPVPSATPRIDPEARDIYQAHIDATNAAIEAEDYEAFAAHFSLPLWIATLSETFVIRDVPTARKTFESVCQGRKRSMTTDIVRVLTSAYFVSENEIIGTHETHRMSNSERIGAPFPNKLRLVRDQNMNWRETHCANGILNTEKNYGGVTIVAKHPGLPDLHEHMKG